MPLKLVLLKLTSCGKAQPKVSKVEKEAIVEGS